MKKTAIALAVIALGAFSDMASAIQIDGIDIDAGSYLKVGTVYEGAGDGSTVINDRGQTLTGIGIINSITNNQGVETWANGDNGRELTLQFGGFLSEVIIFTAPSLGNPFGSITIGFSGGWVDFYSDSTPNFAPGSTPIATAVATATDGNLWLDTVGASTGAVCGVLDNCFSGAGTVLTLISTIQGQDLLNIVSGSGLGFLNVGAGLGLANTALNTNLAGTLGQDIALGSSFNNLTKVGDWAASGSLDLKGQQAIPEPATLGLLGLGLVGLAGLRRRKSA